MMKQEYPQNIASNSPDEVLNTTDPGDETQRRYRYQHAYGVILLIAAIRCAKPYTALFCEHHEDLLAKRKDGSFDAYQVKTRQAENGLWSFSDVAIKDSIKRFVNLDQKFPEKIEQYFFVSNIGHEESNARNKVKRSLVKLLEAVKRASSLEELSSPFNLIFERLCLYCKCEPLDLFVVLKKLYLVKGPGLDSFEAEIAQNHLPNLPECNALSAAALAILRDNLIALVYKASSRSIDNPALHWHALNADHHDSPILQAKRILVESIQIFIRRNYPHLLNTSDDTPLQKFYDDGKELRNAQLFLIKDLHLESFKLGDDVAANFPYIIEPLKEVYSQATQALQEASDPAKHSKKGILLLGESNAGKTRLALEVMKQVLPEWLLLRWQPHYTDNHIPPLQMLVEKPLVLLLDDLQEYVSTEIPSSRVVSAAEGSFLGMPLLFENSRTLVLRTLLETLLQATSNIVIVATCRSEYLEGVNAVLGDHFIIKLKELYLPSFNLNIDEHRVKQIITLFQQAGHVHLEDWDGTIGSLVLGLSRKYDQYIALPKYVQVVLKAMKLLVHAFIFFYPEHHLRKICMGLFSQAHNLQEDKLWQSAIDLLLQTQFIIANFDRVGEELELSIRSDSYIEKVISDYPPIHRPGYLEQDLFKLSAILSELGDAKALSNLAVSFSMRESHEKALETFEKALAIDPCNSEFWRYKGKCLLDGLDKYIEALDAYEQALNWDKANVPALIGKGICLIRSGCVDEALQIYEQVLAVEPENVYAINNKGICHFRLEQYQEALLLFNQVLEEDSTYAAAWGNKGVCLCRLKSYQEASDAFQQALLYDPLNISIWKNKIQCLIDLEKDEEALNACEEILRIVSTNAWIWLQQGECLSRLGDYEKALLSYEEVLKLEPMNSTAMINKGAMLGRLKRYTEALKVFDDIIALDSTNKTVWINKSLCLEKLGQSEEAQQTLLLYEVVEWYCKGLAFVREKQYKDAITAFEQYVSLNPNNSMAWYYKGYSLEQLEQYKEALIAFEWSLAFNPDHPIAWYGKGHCLESLGLYEEAAQAYEQVLALDPENIRAWFSRGCCLEWSGKYEKALYAYEKTLTLNPDSHAGIWNSKGFCLGNLGRVEEALHAFEQSIALDPNFATAWANKGRTLQLLGRYNEAVEASQNANSLDSSYPVIEIKSLKQYAKGSYHTSKNIVNSNKSHKRKKHHSRIQQQSYKAYRKKR